MGMLFPVTGFCSWERNWIPLRSLGIYVGTRLGSKNVATFCFLRLFFSLATYVQICRKTTEGQLAITESTIF